MSRQRLLVDIGNSRLKWATARASELVDHRACAWRGRDLVETVIEELSARRPAEEVWICSVADYSDEQRLANWMQRQWGVPVQFARAESSRRGLLSAYADAGQMGADRWLAMLAVWLQTSAAFFLVDCGTAVTVDLVDDHGGHLGGMIAPGLTAMRTSLLEQTARIAAVDGIPKYGLGRDTAGCVAAGTSTAIIGLIERGLKNAIERLGRRPYCLITGGDGEVFGQHLGGQFEYDPHIVLKGLLAYAETAS